MELPLPFTSRQHSESVENTIEDFAPADMPDATEYVTHNSGPHGSFTKADREALIRTTILEENALDDTAVILPQKACIYKYEYNSKTNISVGLVKKVIEGDVENETGKVSYLYEVLQCPPKGAKKDNLYIDICPDSAFNLDFRIRVIDRLERSMILAFNLEMTSNGTFSKKRKSGGAHSLSSYCVAKQVIHKFYKEHN
jgi:hypothetical protein